MVIFNSNRTMSRSLILILSLLPALNCISGARSLNNNGLPELPEKEMAEIVRDVADMVNSGERNGSPGYIKTNILVLGLLFVRTSVF